MARIPLDTEHNGLLARLISWYSRRKLGTFAQPLAAVAHHPGVLLVGTRLEMGVSRRLTLEEHAIDWAAGPDDSDIPSSSRSCFPAGTS